MRILYCFLRKKIVIIHATLGAEIIVNIVDI